MALTEAYINLALLIEKTKCRREEGEGGGVGLDIL